MFCVGLTFLGNLLVDDQRASNRLSTCLGLLSEVGLHIGGEETSYRCFNIIVVLGTGSDCVASQVSVSPVDVIALRRVLSAGESIS